MNSHINIFEYYFKFNIDSLFITKLLLISNKEFKVNIICKYFYKYFIEQVYY